uniref:Snake toxin/toxin-like domain-containing protein n=1 Tax=Gouania willdenowi TaxID=441366 RepID=A0A8C5I705_GOUWI
MKLLVLALALALLFAAGEALNCHRCISKKPGGDCEPGVETCKSGKLGCAAVRFLNEPYGQFQKCMARLDCELLKRNAFINVTCCNTDMCNVLSD